MIDCSPILYKLASYRSNGHKLYKHFCHLNVFLVVKESLVTLVSSV